MHLTLLLYLSALSRHLGNRPCREHDLYAPTGTGEQTDGEGVVVSLSCGAGSLESPSLLYGIANLHHMDVFSVVCLWCDCKLSSCCGAHQVDGSGYAREADAVHRSYRLSVSNLEGGRCQVR